VKTAEFWCVRLIVEGWHLYQCYNGSGQEFLHVGVM